jgi:hypothetical protein
MKSHLRCRPRVEALEIKNLLSHGASGLALGVLHAVRKPENAIRQGPIELGLTTDQTTYSPGQAVRMTFTETNVSNHAAVVAIGPSIDGFVIMHHGRTIWRSNAGPTPDYITRRMLHPGQTLTLTASWTASAQTGLYRVHDQLHPRNPSTSFSIIAATSASPMSSPDPSSPTPAPVPVPVKPIKGQRPVGRPFGIVAATSELASMIASPQSSPSAVVAPVPVPVKPIKGKLPVGRPFAIAAATSPSPKTSGSDPSLASVVVAPVPVPVKPIKGQRPVGRPFGSAGTASRFV